MSTNFTSQLPNISIQISRYFSVLLFLFGTIGNILNCLVFSRQKLRSNPCVIYFLTASIFNLISIIIGLYGRILKHWHILPDFTEFISILCQIRLFILFSARNIASWLLVCAIIDRFLVSSLSIRFRRMSNIKQAHRCIFIVCTSSIIYWLEVFICFDADLVHTPLKCYAKSSSCRIFNDLSQALITTFIPSFIMLIFGLRTIANIHRVKLMSPILPRKRTYSRRKIRKDDTTLTRMLFLQVILLTIFNIPQAIQKFYITNTFYQSKSLSQRIIEQFFFNIGVLLTYIPNCLPFYIYTFTGVRFRTTLFYMFRQMTCRIR